MTACHHPQGSQAEYAARMFTKFNAMALAFAVQCMVIADQIYPQCVQPPRMTAHRGLIAVRSGLAIGVAKLRVMILYDP